MPSPTSTTASYRRAASTSSSYRDASLRLKYASKDVKDLEGLFAGMKSRYKKIKVKTYLDEEVTPAAIKNAKAFLKDATIDDTLVLFIAGHGVHDDAGEYYFVTHGTNINDLPNTATAFEAMEDLLHGIAPRQKLFLMDTCESGELDEGVEATTLAAAASVGIRSRGIARTGRVREGHQARVVTQKGRFIYNDLLRRSGAIVFSSSRGGEYSYESDEVKNGFFTNELIKALKTGAADKNGDGIVSVDELRDYVSAAVAAKTHDLQHPTIDRDNLYQRVGFPTR